jgi:hypothetical protein
LRAKFHWPDTPAASFITAAAASLAAAAGGTPFAHLGDDELRIYRRILRAKFHWPDTPAGNDISADARDLAAQLLQREPSKRLGMVSTCSVLCYICAEWCPIYCAMVWWRQNFSDWERLLDISADARDLAAQLLQRDLSKRLGMESTSCAVTLRHILFGWLGSFATGLTPAGHDIYLRLA